MRRLPLLFLLAALPAFGQAIDSSQVKKKTNGGIVGDTAYNLAVGVYRASSAPSSPVTGQLWCDTTTTPCVLMTYNGSTWETSPSPINVPYQADLTSLPASPVDGQIFYAKSSRFLLIYNASDSTWNGFPAQRFITTTAMDDVPDGNVITAPTAPTATRAAACGAGMTVGDISYKITYYNSTGGETDGGAVSNTITLTGATDCGQLTNIPTGGTGTIGRRIYKTPATTPAANWQWIGTIADNTTTTWTDAVTNASLKIYIPAVNYSGALPANWTAVNDSSATTSGGCGTTADLTFRCQGSNVAPDGTVAKGSDISVRANRDLSAYVSGDWTVTARYLYVGAIQPPVNEGCPYNTNSFPITFAGVRNGTNANAIRLLVGLQAGSVAFCGGTSSSNATFGYNSRGSTGGNAGVGTVFNHGWPGVSSLKGAAHPMWVKVIKRGTTMNFFRSPDGVNYAPLWGCGTVNYTDAQCGVDLGTGAANWDHFEVPACQNYQNAGSNWNMVTEWDSFSVTQD